MASMEGSKDLEPFRILDSDYQNYDIFYDCSEFGAFKIESFSVSSRKYTMDSEILDKVK
jgi:hypothetical protein